MPSVRDSLFGYVNFDELEWAVLNSKAVQRLRFIRQMGFASLIYPGAEHSRFSHMIGSFALAARMHEALEARYGLKMHGSQSRTRVRLLALLAQVGSLPFSSQVASIEGCAPVYVEELTDIFRERGEEQLLGDLRILTTQGTLAGDIVNVGPLSAMSMDALLRDSCYCGVKYGVFDVDRLVESLSVVAEPSSGGLRLDLEASGGHAFQGFLLARRFMNAQVYRHPRRLAYELHFQAWLRGEDFKELSQTKLSEIDDYAILAKMRKSTNTHAYAIVNRAAFPLAFEGAVSTRSGDSSLEEIENKLKERFGANDLLFGYLEPDRIGPLDRVLENNLSEWVDKEKRVLVFAPLEIQVSLLKLLGELW